MPQSASKCLIAEILRAELTPASEWHNTSTKQVSALPLTEIPCFAHINVNATILHMTIMNMYRFV